MLSDNENLNLTLAELLQIHIQSLPNIVFKWASNISSINVLKIENMRLVHKDHFGSCSIWSKQDVVLILIIENFVKAWYFV